MPEQFLKFIKLYRRPGDIRVHRPQIGNEFFLIVALPDVVFRKSLEQIFSGHAHKLIAVSLGQIFHVQGRAIILILQQLKRRAHVGEQRLLESRQFVRVLREHIGVTLQHRLA